MTEEKEKSKRKRETKPKTEGLTEAQKEAVRSYRNSRESAKRQHSSRLSDKLYYLLMALGIILVSSLAGFAWGVLGEEAVTLETQSHILFATFFSSVVCLMLIVIWWTAAEADLGGNKEKIEAHEGKWGWLLK